MHYHEALRIIADKTKHPLPQLTTVEGKKITVALRHGGNTDAFLDMIHQRHRCNTCISRSKRLGRLSIPDKKGHPMPLFLVSSTLLDDSYAPLYQANEQLCTTPIVGLSVLVGSHVEGYLEKEGMEISCSQPFRHYHICIPEDKRSEISSTEAKLLEKAFQRYCSSLLPQLLDTLLPKDGPGTPLEKITRLQESLRIVESALSEAVYGNHLAPSVQWLLRIADFFEKEGKLPHQRTKAQMWLLCAEMLLWTSIHPDGRSGSGVVSPVIQQAHGHVIPLMDKAVDKKAMIRMISDRMSPLNYQRPTAAPTKGQVENAMATLGEFSNRVLTMEEAAALPHAILCRSQETCTSSSMAAFQDMLGVTKPKKNPASLADRCRGITTLTQLLSEMRNHPEKKLELQVQGMSRIYVAGTTLDPAKLCVPHLWAFLGSFPKNFPDEWSEVAVIHPLYEYLPQYRTILFVLHKVHHPPAVNTMTNCCFPEFLDVQYRRICRSAFEDINKRLSIKIKKGQTLAMGVGVSATNDAGKLNKPLKVRVDGRVYEIDTL